MYILTTALITHGAGLAYNNASKEKSIYIPNLSIAIFIWRPLHGKFLLTQKISKPVPQ